MIVQGCTAIIDADDVTAIVYKFIHRDLVYESMCLPRWLAACQYVESQSKYVVKYMNELWKKRSYSQMHTLSATDCNVRCGYNGDVDCVGACANSIDYRIVLACKKFVAHCGEMHCVWWGGGAE